ncbi:uncharacterized protein LOC136078406 [Hydra vulgaris]|uniref:Uncharacterized protein LOC136078406 n=1 Tax=Hydra vulgaris TaxID=6087 RepID=A0ABM4BME4_HYDVU
MAVTIDQIEKMMKKMFKEFKKETESMIKQQEKNVLNIISVSTKILYERLDIVESNEKIRSVVNSQEKCITTSAIQSNESAFIKIRGKLREMEDRSRRNKLRIEGVKENDGESREDSEMKVNKIFENYLGLKGIKIERAHRTGQKNSVKPIPIIIKLLDFKDKIGILKKTTNLKGKNIYINEDFCAETVQIRSLREQMKIERAAGKFATISYDKLIIRYWASKKSNNLIS